MANLEKASTEESVHAQVGKSGKANSNPDHADDRLCSEAFGMMQTASSKESGVREVKSADLACAKDRTNESAKREGTEGKNLEGKESAQSEKKSGFNGTFASPDGKDHYNVVDGKIFDGDGKHFASIAHDGKVSFESRFPPKKDIDINACFNGWTFQGQENGHARIFTTSADMTRGTFWRQENGKPVKYDVNMGMMIDSRTGEQYGILQPPRYLNGRLNGGYILRSGAAASGQAEPFSKFENAVFDLSLMGQTGCEQRSLRGVVQNPQKTSAAGVPMQGSGLLDLQDVADWQRRKRQISDQKEENQEGFFNHAIGFLSGANKEVADEHRVDIRAEAEARSLIGRLLAIGSADESILARLNALTAEAKKALCVDRPAAREPAASDSAQSEKARSETEKAKSSQERSAIELFGLNSDNVGKVNGLLRIDDEAYRIENGELFRIGRGDKLSNIEEKVGNLGPGYTANINGRGAICLADENRVLMQFRVEGDPTEHRVLGTGRAHFSSTGEFDKGGLVDLNKLKAEATSYEEKAQAKDAEYLASKGWVSGDIANWLKGDPESQILANTIKIHDMNHSLQGGLDGLFAKGFDLSKVYTNGIDSQVKSVQRLLKACGVTATTSEQLQEGLKGMQQLVKEGGIMGISTLAASAATALTDGMAAPWLVANAGRFASLIRGAGAIAAAGAANSATNVMMRYESGQTFQTAKQNAISGFGEGMAMGIPIGKINSAREVGTAFLKYIVQTGAMAAAADYREHGSVSEAMAAAVSPEKLLTGSAFGLLSHLGGQSLARLPFLPRSIAQAEETIVKRLGREVLESGPSAVQKEMESLAPAGRKELQIALAKLAVPEALAHAVQSAGSGFTFGGLNAMPQAIDQQKERIARELHKDKSSLTYADLLKNVDYDRLAHSVVENGLVAGLPALAGSPITHRIGQWQSARIEAHLARAAGEIQDKSEPEGFAQHKHSATQVPAAPNNSVQERAALTQAPDAPNNSVQERDALTQAPAAPNNSVQERAALTQAPDAPNNSVQERDAVSRRSRLSEGIEAAQIYQFFRQVELPEGRTRMEAKYKYGGYFELNKDGRLDTIVDGHDTKYSIERAGNSDPTKIIGSNGETFQKFDGLWIHSKDGKRVIYSSLDINDADGSITYGKESRTGVKRFTRKPDGSLIDKSGRLVEANLGAERSKLSYLSSQLEPDTRFWLSGFKKAFDQVAAQRMHLPLVERARLFHEVSEILSASSSKLPISERGEIAVQILNNSVDPFFLNQGYNSTCPEAQLSVHMYANYPSESARLIKEVVTRGEVKVQDSHLADGSPGPLRSIHIRTEDMQADPDTRAAYTRRLYGRDREFQGLRMQSDKILQNLIVNSYWQAREYGPSGEYCGQGNIRYENHPSSGAADTGERLVANGKTLDNKPSVHISELEDINFRLTGRKEEFVMAHSQIWEGLKNEFASVAELDKKLDRLLLAGAPVIVAVRHNKGAAVPDHVVSVVRKYTKDGETYVYLDNTHGMEKNTPDQGNGIKLRDLFNSAMPSPKAFLEHYRMNYANHQTLEDAIKSTKASPAEAQRLRDETKGKVLSPLQYRDQLLSFMRELIDDNGKFSHLPLDERLDAAEAAMRSCQYLDRGERDPAASSGNLTVRVNGVERSQTGPEPEALEIRPEAEDNQDFVSAGNARISTENFKQSSPKEQMQVLGQLLSEVDSRMGSQAKTYQQSLAKLAGGAKTLLARKEAITKSRQEADELGRLHKLARAIVSKIRPNMIDLQTTEEANALTKTLSRIMDKDQIEGKPNEPLVLPDTSRSMRSVFESLSDKTFDEKTLAELMSKYSPDQREAIVDMAEKRKEFMSIEGLIGKLRQIAPVLEADLAKGLNCGDSTFIHSKSDRASHGLVKEVDVLSFADSGQARALAYLFRKATGIAVNIHVLQEGQPIPADRKMLVFDSPASLSAARQAELRALAASPNCTLLIPEQVKDFHNGLNVFDALSTVHSADRLKLKLKDMGIASYASVQAGELTAAELNRVNGAFSGADPKQSAIQKAKVALFFAREKDPRVSAFLTNLLLKRVTTKELMEQAQECHKKLTAGKRDLNKLLFVTGRDNGGSTDYATYLYRLANGFDGRAYDGRFVPERIARLRHAMIPREKEPALVYIDDSINSGTQAANTIGGTGVTETGKKQHPEAGLKQNKMETVMLAFAASKLGTETFQNALNDPAALAELEMLSRLREDGLQAMKRAGLIRKDALLEAQTPETQHLELTASERAMIDKYMSPLIAAEQRRLLHALKQRYENASLVTNVVHDSVDDKLRRFISSKLESEGIIDQVKEAIKGESAQQKEYRLKRSAVREAIVELELRNLYKALGLGRKTMLGKSAYSGGAGRDFRASFVMSHMVPNNDVALMRRLFVDYLGFPSATSEARNKYKRESLQPISAG